MLNCIFKKTTISLLLLAVLTLVTGVALAQGDKPAGVAGQNPSVTGAATADRVRIAAPSAVVQLRLEVYDEAGQKLLDSEQRGGNVLDWHLQRGTGERVADGNYLCVVTIKSLSGRLSQRLGLVNVNARSTTLRPASVADLSVQQAQAVGPVESEAAGLSVMATENAQSVTVLANNGDEGQLARTRGALSFRVGDFFSGDDKEQMRLTEEGNLGIGTSKPAAKLDVAGMIRAREGFLFSDGSKLNVNDKGALTVTGASGTVVPNVGGTGSTGRLARWTDNSGNLGDSVAIDTGSGLQLTAAASSQVDTNVIFLNGSDRTTGMIAAPTASFTSFNGPFFAMRGNTYSAIAGQRGLFAISAGNVSSPTGREGSVIFNSGNDQIRMLISPTGNVGVGTTTPQSLLDVAGDLKVAGNATVAGNIAAKYQDIAEWVQTRHPIAAGTVVSLDSSLSNAVTRSVRAYDTHVAGVVSAMPGVVLGQGGDGKVLVSTTGRVQVTVDATRHPIKIGDLLVTSDAPGLAMKSQPIRVNGVLIHRSGTIIGKALEPLAKGRGKILVLLSLQ